MHIVHCPYCSWGTKCVVFIITASGPRPLFLGKYSSCECRLTDLDKAQMAAEAKKEAAVV